MYLFLKLPEIAHDISIFVHIKIRKNARTDIERFI